MVYRFPAFRLQRSTPTWNPTSGVWFDTRGETFDAGKVWDAFEAVEQELELGGDTDLDPVFDAETEVDEDNDIRDLLELDEMDDETCVGRASPLAIRTEVKRRQATHRVLAVLRARRKLEALAAIPECDSLCDAG